MRVVALLCACALSFTAAQSFSARHLILGGCYTNDPRKVLLPVPPQRDALQQAVQFDTVHCPADDNEEKAIVDALVANSTATTAAPMLLVLNGLACGWSVAALQAHQLDPVNNPPVTECPATPEWYSQQPFTNWYMYESSLKMGSRAVHMWVGAERNPPAPGHVGLTIDNSSARHGP